MSSFDFYLLISIILTEFQTNGARIFLDKHFSISSNDLLIADLERISSKMLASLDLLVDNSKMERLHNLANSQPEPMGGYQDIQFLNYDYQLDYGKDYASSNQTMKREIGLRSDNTLAEKILNETSIEYDYDLDKFKAEYDTLTIMTLKIATINPDSRISGTEYDSESPFEPTIQNEKHKRCIHMRLWKHAVFGPMCLWREFKTTESFINLFSNLYILILIVKTLFLWTWIWAFVAVGMWCWRGNCCCCLPFFILHPIKGLRSIKLQLSEEESQEEGKEIKMTPYWLQLEEQKNKLRKEIQDLVFV